MGLINALGNLGGFTGPFVVGYLNSRSGNFVSGFIFLGASAIAVAILAGLLSLREGRAAVQQTCGRGLSEERSPIRRHRRRRTSLGGFAAA